MEIKVMFRPDDEQGLNTDSVPDGHLECDMKILSDVMTHANTLMFRLILNSCHAQVLGFNLTCPMDPSSLTEAAAFHRRAVSRAAEGWAAEPHDRL